MIRQFFENIRRLRDEQRGRLPERHLDGPGIRPDQIATGPITPDKLVAGSAAASSVQAKEVISPLQAREASAPLPSQSADEPSRDA